MFIFYVNRIVFIIFTAVFLSNEETWFPEFVTANTKDFIDGLLKRTVETFDEVKRHHCFTNLDWAKVGVKVRL